MAGAVQSPPQTVVEERPSSADSVDVDVERYLNAPRLSQKVKHPTTGRVISFSEVGDPKGFAIFCCVGMGLTRYIMGFYDQLAITLRLRLITPERPGVGGSEPDPNGTPLSWADDVLVICQALKITKFSLLAHSAGAIYALATALRMPQHIRGRVHLLAPWIPPSQMAPIGVNQPPAGGQLPRTQRFLRVLPPALLKVANSSFLSATSASLQRTGPKNSPKTKRKSLNTQAQSPQPQRPPIGDTRRESIMLMDQVKMPNASSLSLAATNPADPNYERAKKMKDALTQAELERCQAYEAKLTFEIWDRATTNANPATDLVVCLETRNTIGFRYEDITRGVVIHHGSKDSRVPVDNVRWLGSVMRRCEVRILEGEHHGLMASGTVMGNVLTEMAREWEDWTAVVQGKAVGGGRDRSASRRRT
jgi:pimeloyl-ACP methyl ester carboxylesterase